MTGMVFFLSGHSTLANRGCEALVRTTSMFLRRELPDARFLVPSSDPVADTRQWPSHANSGVEFVAVPKVLTSSRLARKGWRTIAGKRRLSPFSPRFDDSLDGILSKVHGTVSIGGDMYSAEYGLDSLREIMAVNASSTDRGLPTFLWGASVGPFPGHVSGLVADHLRRLDGISVREQITADYLSSLGVARVMVRDGAFWLKPEPVQLPSKDAPMRVGFNMSPLIQRVAKKWSRPDFVTLISAMLDAIITEFDCEILLIAHVTSRSANKTGCDLALLQEAARLCHARDRIKELPDTVNAAQLKYAISTCDLFVGARTHATIAAFSSKVPTVSVAYSRKARGLNEDLFGSTKFLIEAMDLEVSSIISALRTADRERNNILQCLTGEWLVEGETAVSNYAAAVANLVSDRRGSAA